MKRFLLSMALAFVAFTVSAADFKVVVLRVQFSDCRFSGDDSAAELLLRSSESYFNSQFRGARTFSFSLGPVVTLPSPLSYYGANVSDTRDKLLYQGLKNACSLADGRVDFSQFDNNGNGDVDLVAFVVAGPSEARGAGEDYIWPLYSNFGKHYVSLPKHDGKQINNYMVCTEIVDNVSYGDVGTFCHEFGHYLGLPDFYDTDGEYSGGLSDGLYGTSLMDGGSSAAAFQTPPPINAVESHILGLGTPAALELGSVSLSPLEDSGQYLVCDGLVDGEKYFFENRKGKGLMIYHYDKSSNSAGMSTYYRKTLTAGQRWDLDEVNCCPDHECVKLVAPSSEDSLLFWPAGNHKSFGSGTTPAFSFWDGSYSRFCLTDISMDNGSVKFNVVEPVRISLQTFQESAFLSAEVDGSLGPVSRCELRCMSSDGSTLSRTKVPKTGDDIFVCKIGDLNPNETYSYELSVDTEDGKFVTVDSFRTRTRVGGTCPYINLSAASKNPDGSYLAGSRLPLVLMNVTGAENVVWYLDSEEITLGTDGCLELKHSGELRALVTYESGKTEVFRKTLTVR